MNDVMQVPENIANIIETKKKTMEAEARARQETEQQERQKMIEQGKSIWQEYLKDAIQRTPEWLRPYQTDDDMISEENCERLVKGWDKPENHCLGFDVPGLAPLKFDARNNSWTTAQVYYREYEGNEPVFSFHNSFSHADLACALVQAEASFILLQKKKIEYADRQQKEEAEYREQELRRETSLSEVTAKYEQAKQEDQKLFDAIKEDPIAIHLLKAFLSLHQERTMFEQQISEANDGMYSMEERWSRKAADLRRQAEDAERRASEEHNRAADIEDDLDNAKKKLKQAERGW